MGHPEQSTGGTMQVSGGRDLKINEVMERMERCQKERG